MPEGMGWEMRQTRRRFLQALGATGAGVVGSSGTAADTRPTTDDDLEAVDGTVGGISFYSPASQLNANREPLADDDVALVRAEPTAFNFETTDDGPEWAPVLYEDGDPAIPLVSQDTEDPVVGFGTTDFVADGTGGFSNDNEMVLLNLFDELVGPGSVIAFDEKHSYLQDLDDYRAFTAYADDQGYDLRVSEELRGSGALKFPSTSSQVSATGGPLTDPDSVAVWAERTAENTDESGNGVEYPADTDIPLVSRDGGAIGVGTAEFVTDETGTANNRQLLSNLLVDAVGDSGRVLWDDAHGTSYTADGSLTLLTSLAEAGYDVRSTGDSLVTELVSPDPSTAGAESEHTWTLEDPEFGMPGEDGDEVETITVEYEAASLDGLDQSDVTVTMTRTLASGKDTSEIDVNQDQYSGSSATFDLDGGYQTDAAGPVVVEIDGITNPGASETASITLDGDADPYTREGELSIGPPEAPEVSTAIPELEFFSTSTVLDGSGNPLTDSGRIAVWAASTATQTNNQGTFVAYPDGTDLPLVGIDGGVVAIGSDFATDQSEESANRLFLANVWENRLDGTGTVRYDETHGQSYTLDGDYSQLATVAEGRGFAVESITEDFTGALEDADAVMIATNNDDVAGAGGFTDAELTALSEFVANGGVLFLHDTADFGGDSTAELNAVLSAVGADLQFNTDQVVDDTNNGFAPFVPRTGNFNESFDLFGIGVEPGTIETSDAVIVPSPGEGYTDEERGAVETHVETGGAVVMLDTVGPGTGTTALDEIADTLDLSFRFNTDQVTDAEYNSGTATEPATTKYNTGFEVFDGLTPGLVDVDGVMIPTPLPGFFGEELDALSTFVDNDGAVFLFDQSDFGGQGEDEEGLDQTANLNVIADSLGLDFRFNSDQVNDEENNTGSVFDPLTANYDASNPVFDEREEGIGIEFDPETDYTGRVVEVFDGDTLQVKFDDSEYGFRDVVRNVGIDTAETTAGANDPREWFGLPDDQTAHLEEWGGKGTQFALDRFAPESAEDDETVFENGRRVNLRFDDREPVRGTFGRILAHVEYDPDEFAPDPPAGEYSTNYNREVVQEGRARVYSSGFADHDEFATDEEDALANRTGVWGPADFDALGEYRTAFTQSVGVFVPRASSVTGTNGPLDGDNGPTPILHAGESATQEPLDGDGGFDEYEGAPPLAAVDIDERVAMFGGQLLEEGYEAGEDDDITGEFDLASAGNFTLFTNTVELLTDNEGPFIVEGGHGQFGVDGGASLEDLKYYLRHVEGLSAQVDGAVRLRQMNTIEETLPAEPEPPRVVFLTALGRAYTQAELDTLRGFRDAGGAVVLLGSAAPTPEERGRLNAIADALGTDLRLNDDRVVDESGPLAPELLVTENIESAHGLRLPVDLDRKLDGVGVMAALDNEGIEAWRLAAASDGVGPVGENDPTLTFAVGKRHYIENRPGADAYPLAFHDADGNPLLTQDPDEGPGEFEGDPEVDWVDTGDVVEFTLTEDLAAELDSYICPDEQTMTGSILTSDDLDGPPQLSPAFAGPPRDLDNDGLYEDVDGDGQFTIFDVQAFFETFRSEPVIENAESFDFSGSGGPNPDIGITDVQALFDKL